MGKLFNFILAFITLFALCIPKQIVSAESAGKVLVAPVNILTVRSSYGVYPNTVDMIANDIINTLNRNSNLDVPDLSTSSYLIDSYGLSEDYKAFLTNYRDNRVINHQICNKFAEKLGFGTILLISTGYDTQSLFLKRSKSSKISDISEGIMPFGRLLSKDLLFLGLPFLYNKARDSFHEQEGPITPNYTLNVRFALIDTTTGLSLWEGAYRENFPSSDFGNPINSFGENIISSEKLKEFSEQLSKKASIEIYTAAKNSNYTSVQSSIVDVSNKKDFSRDGYQTMDGQPFYNNPHQEMQRKESYKNWIKGRLNNP